MRIKKLDAYIIGKYLKSFVFVALMFTMIALIIDYSEKVDDFIKEAVPTSRIIFEYYLMYIPFINGLLWPLYALITVIFFTSRLAYNSEIISILNAGVSFRRLMRPYLIGAAIIGGIHLLGNHIFIPMANNIRLNFEYATITKDEDYGKVKDVHMFISADTKVYIRFYSKRDTTASDFRIERFKDGELVYLLEANKAQWMGPPNHWRLFNYQERTFDGMQESLKVGLNEQLDTTINLYPADFVRYKNFKQMMTTPELIHFIYSESERGIGNTKVYEIELHRRTAEPFTIVILTIIGMAVASRKVRGGMGLHLAIGIALGAVFIFLSKFAVTFATSNAVPAILGIWIPNFCFTAVALRLIARAQK